MEGKRVDLGGRRSIKKKKEKKRYLYDGVRARAQESGVLDGV